MAAPGLSSIRTLKDIPAVRQIGMLAAVAMAVALGIGSWFWSQRPAMTPVFGNLSDKDAGEVAEALRTANIPYQLDEATGAVTVPAAQVHDARLKLAAQGLPHGAAQGFEMIQQEQGFGTSQFIETARYQHALETELGRTVASLQPVRAARVHLALPKPSAFTRDHAQASASVLVDLHPGRQLEQNQVASIVHLVASSVPDLLPSGVTVIDGAGHLLTNSDGNPELALTTEQFEHARRVEADYVRRVEQLLTPMLGAGRVSAQVSADMDFAVTEEAHESYQPDPRVRSEQTAEDIEQHANTPGGAGGSGAQGVPGATSNQPPSTATSPPLNATFAASSDATSKSTRSTRNYELDKTVSHTRQPTGTVKRLSVAVVVDYLPKVDDKKVTTFVPLSPEELAKVESLVKEAVGFSTARGDSVTVQNAAFFQPEGVTAESLPFWQRADLRDLARQGGGAVLVLVLILAVLRPLLKTLLSTPVSRPALEGVLEAGAARTLADERALLTATPGQAYEQRLQLARSAVAQDPKRVAQVVKSWVAEGG
jgi:flagellar M-ring protein FliF